MTGAAEERRSRFAPSPEEMREQERAAARRAENLAGRIVQARRAVRSGQSMELVLAILDGKADGPAGLQVASSAASQALTTIAAELLRRSYTADEALVTENELRGWSQRIKAVSDAER